MGRLQRVAAVLLVLAAGCSAGTTQGVATPQTISTGLPSAEASEQAPIPEELLGDWESQKGTDPVVLTFLESGQYRVRRGYARGFGSMAADGKRLEFFGGDPCLDRGSYEWSIQEGTLTFIPVGRDQCPGRAAVLDGLVYTRSD
jgi:hypothetical protein